MGFPETEERTVNSRPVAASWAACCLLAGPLLLAWGQAPPAPPDRCVEVILAVDGMV